MPDQTRPDAPADPAPHTPRARVALAGLTIGLPSLIAGVLLAAHFSFALPPVPTPVENPTTEAKCVLGKVLFMDEQLASNNAVACVSCHIPGRAGADPRIARHPGLDGLINTPDDILGSPGVIMADAGANFVRSTTFGTNAQITPRASQPNINVAFAPQLFWDGRASGQFIDPQTGQVAIAVGGALESQSVQPPVNTVEMAHPSYDWPAITAKLARVKPLDLATNIPADVSSALAARDTYPELFQAAFGDSAITARRIAFALAAYQRTLISDQTPFDRFLAGQQNALTPGQQQGLNAFNAGNCNVCHAGDLLTNHTFRNVGLRPPGEDLGRQLVTGNPADRGRFKVPGLRNVGLKATFMHNGQFNNLTDVIRFYARAPGAAPQFPDNRDPVMNNVNVPPQVAPALQDFLANALTDPRVQSQTFPFDKPTIFGERADLRPVNLNGGVAGTGGVIPRVIAADPAMIGNRDFRVGLDAALGGAPARLLVSFAPPANGRITPARTYGDVAAVGVGAGTGLATFHWPLAAHVFQGGQNVFLQWEVDDPAAPAGKAYSNVVRLTTFCGRSGCPCPADFDGSGFVDADDFVAYLDAFDRGCVGEGRGTFGADPNCPATADFDNSGFVDSDDYVLYLGRFDQGC
ncbi:MAG: cytochrome c peroxidase [Planctomycetota bacterium]|nr:cytochrome c peroxidase [Planctomycetota bacterium]